MRDLNVILNYKRKRRNLRITQTEVAKKIGISRYTLAKYEMGMSEMPITVAIKLMIYFEKNADIDIF